MVIRRKRKIVLFIELCIWRIFDQRSVQPPVMRNKRSEMCERHLFLYFDVLQQLFPSVFSFRISYYSLYVSASGMEVMLRCHRYLETGSS